MESNDPKSLQMESNDPKSLQMEPNDPKPFDYIANGNLFSDKVGHLERREEFRKYLDRTNVLDRLTTVLMDLYECPAINFPVIEYVRTRLVDSNPDHREAAVLQRELNDARSLRKRLKQENRELRATVERNKRRDEPTEETQ